MASFVIAGRRIELPAIPIHPRSPSRDDTAWRLGERMTVRLISPISGIRLHTDGRKFQTREEASNSKGAWVALGDVIGTSSELADSRALPTLDPTSFVAFTHTNEATLPAHCVINIGIASAKWGGRGGGFQAEYVSGPEFEFRPLVGKLWHGRAGRA